MQEMPIVVFVEDRAYGVASITDNGMNGLTTLVNIFLSLGARVQSVSLGDDLPEDARVVVLIRPRRALSGDYLARLWVHLEKGNNLLLALDPPGHLGSNPDAQNGGLDRLLSWDYGVSLLNGLIVKPWGSQSSISSPQGSLIQAQTGAISNSIIDPLVRYEIPIRMWGARPVTAELLGVDGRAETLLTTEGYAETNAQVFRRDNPAPLEVNIGADPQGKLVLGAVGENDIIHSRVAVLGDSESLLNGYGLVGTPPRNPGNVILAQRLAAWLLELPEETWLPLPTDFTWLEIDGSDSDWPQLASTTINATSDTGILSLSIQQVRAFRDEDFLYLLVQTNSTPSVDAQLDMHFDPNVDGTIDVEVIADASGIFVKDETGETIVVPDARIAIGDHIEVRLPLRITGLSSRIPSLCLTSTRELAFPTSDCLDIPIAARAFAQRAPSDLLFPDSLEVTVVANGAINLRSAPNTTAPIVGTLRNGEILAAVGRNEAGDWVQVQSARISGWVAAFLLTANGDVQLLSVTE